MSASLKVCNVVMVVSILTSLLRTAVIVHTFGLKIMRTIVIYFLRFTLGNDVGTLQSFFCLTKTKKNSYEYAIVFNTFAIKLFLIFKSKYKLSVFSNFISQRSVLEQQTVLF